MYYAAIFVTGVILVLGAAFVSPRFRDPFTAQPGSTTLEAPEEAVPARFTEMSGDVFQYARSADGFTPATPSGSIRQGEAVATTDGEAVLSVGDEGSVILDKGAEVAFVSLMQDALLFLHKSGSIRYITGKPHFSVRISRAVIDITGTSVIERETDGFILSVTEGNARIGYVDADNVTHVTDIPEGSRADFSENPLSLSVR